MLSSLARISINFSLKILRDLSNLLVMSEYIPKAWKENP